MASTRRFSSLPVPALVAIACVAMAGEAPTAPPTGGPPQPPMAANTMPVRTPQTIQASDVDDLLNVTKVKFLVSGDEGRTWTLSQEVPVNPAKPAAPSFTFAPPADGVWLVVTAASWKNRSPEAEPRPGQVPAKHLRLLVDNTPPTIQQFALHAEPVADQDATVFTLHASWAVQEVNLAQAAIELSTDAGTTFVPAQAIGLSGTVKLSIPRAGSVVQVRLSARDSAGNLTTSPVQSITVPVPPDPEKTLAAAIANLPALEAVQPVINAPTAPAASTGGDAPTAATAANEPVVSPVATALTTAPLPASSTTRAIAVPGARFLSGDAAQAELMQARTLRDGGDIDGALAKYLRLQRSDIADIATLDTLRMLQGVGDHAAAVDIGEGLPPELRTDAVRVALADSHLAFRRWADAEQTVKTIRKGSPQARPALLVFAKAALGKGDTTRFTRLVEFLAGGTDETGAEAKSLRGK